MPNAPLGLAHPLVDLTKVGCAEVRHFHSRDIGPEIFHRVQVRRVWRQKFHLEPFLLRTNVIARDFTFVRRERIPNQEQFSPAHESLQTFQIFDDVRTFHGTVLCGQKQPNATAGNGCDQSPNGRQSFPTERLPQDRRLSTRCPCPAHGRPLRKAAFVQKSDEPFQFADFFLRRGQRSSVHCRTTLLLRSRACLSGFWQLHPSPRRRRQTC